MRKINFKVKKVISNSFNTTKYKNAKNLSKLNFNETFVFAFQLSFWILFDSSVLSPFTSKFIFQYKSDKNQFLFQ